MNYLDNKYDQYNVDDWVVDDDFISYVNGSENPLFSKLENSPEHLAKINEAKAMIVGLGRTAPQVSDSKINAIFEKINSSINDKAEVPKQPKILNFRNFALLGGIAAAIVFLIVFIPSFGTNDQSYSTAIGEKESIRLPDKSLVELNNSSEIVFDGKEWDRNITLTGEAFFQVEKGSKFTVTSSQGRVSVLGTQFNVYDRAGYYEVECLEGKVQVDLEGGGTFILNAGDKLSDFNNQQDPVVKKNVVQRIDWLNKFVQVDSMDLGFVFDELGRYYEVDFVNATKIRGKRYEGFFTTRSLDSAVYQILWPLGIDYSIEGNKVIIK